LEEYERLFERALRALDRERPARRVPRRLRDDVGQAVELLNTMERFDGETDDAEAQYIQALERFRKEVQVSYLERPGVRRRGSRRRSAEDDGEYLVAHEATTAPDARVGAFT